MNQKDGTAFQGYHILVVDDEKDICDIIQFNLEQEGYQVTVSHNGLDAMGRLERNLPDAVILDLMLPGIGGMDFCKQVKSKYEVPIIMVTARSGETDAVLGLEMGADDYVRKPFSPRELLARLRAVLRRNQSERSAETRSGNLEIGTIQIDTTAHRVTVDDQPIDLTLIEYRLLHTFMENPEIAFSRDRLLDRVWGSDVYVSDRTVDVNIKRLREKLGSQKDRLETVRGVGYRFRDDRLKNPSSESAD